MAAITDLKVKSLKPKATRYIAWFDDGLGVRVAPTGRKTFFTWYRRDSRKRALTIGEYPAVSVKEALTLHKEAKAQVRRGGDPAADKQAKRAAVRAAQGQVLGGSRSLTLRKVFERWVAVDLTSRTEDDGKRLGRKDSGASARQEFENWIFPSLGERPARDVTKGDVMEVLDKAKGEGKRRTAQSIFSNLRQMFDFAADREYVDSNPLQTLRKSRVVGRLPARQRVLADWEVKRLLQRLSLLGIHPVTALAIKFVLATGQRPGEVAGMTKAELSTDGTLWTIPGARYKTGETQHVPLSAFARDLLSEAATHNTDSAYVFPTPRAVGEWVGGLPPAKDGCIDRHSLSRAVLRKRGTPTSREAEPAAGEIGLEPFRPHDLRRTCRTQLAALGVPEHIAERVIGHKLQGIMAVYNLHDYLDERRAALERWGQHLAGLQGE